MKVQLTLVRQEKLFTKKRFRQYFFQCCILTAAGARIKYENIRLFNLFIYFIFFFDPLKIVSRPIRSRNAAPYLYARWRPRRIFRHR